MASRIAARSTTQGTPVKSCRITRAGVKLMSWAGSLRKSAPARASMSAFVVFSPSSVRSRFSSRTLIEYGRREIGYFGSSAFNAK